MDSAISQYVLSYGGAAGLCLLLIMLGLLIPKAFHDRELAAGQRELTMERQKSQKLQETVDRLQAALDIERGTNERLTSSGQLTNQLVGALIRIADERRPGPDEGTGRGGA